MKPKQPEEVWKDIKGYEGLYQISSEGRMKSFAKSEAGYILSNVNKYGWYFTMVLFRNGISKTARIHRLVAEAFVPNPKHKKEVHHRDGNKQNNQACNLEWVTHKEHMKITLKENPSMIAGMNNYNKHKKQKPVSQYTISGEHVATYIGCKEAGATTGVCPRNIHQVASKTEYKPNLIRKQAGGFVWAFESRTTNGN